MKRLLIALAFLFIPSIAWSQCNGIFPANTLCGNLSASPAPPAAFTAAGTTVGPASSTSGAVVTWANNLGTLLGPGTTSVFSKGTSGAIQASNGTSGFVDSTVSIQQPPVTSGYWLQLPSFTQPGFTAFTLFGNNITINTSPGNYAHEFGGCSFCQIFPSSAGSVFLVGNDGSNPAIIGSATLNNSFHMTILGGSPDCEGSGDVCIGHAATAISPGDTVVGNAASDTSTQGGNIILGAGNIGGSVQNSIILGSTSAVMSGTGNFNMMALGTCTISSFTNVVAIGQFLSNNGCPTANGQILVGGTQASAVLAGTTSGTTVAGNGIPFIGGGMFSTGNAPGLNAGACKGTSWVGGSLVGQFTANGGCANTSSYILTLNTLATASTNGYVCTLQDTNSANVRFGQTGINTNAPSFTVPSSPYSQTVQNGDIIAVQCQGY